MQYLGKWRICNIKTIWVKSWEAPVIKRAQKFAFLRWEKTFIVLDKSKLRDKSGVNCRDDITLFVVNISFKDFSYPKLGSINLQFLHGQMSEILKGFAICYPSLERDIPSREDIPITYGIFAGYQSYADIQTVHVNIFTIFFVKLLKISTLIIENLDKFSYKKMYIFKQHYCICTEILVDTSEL